MSKSLDPAGIAGPRRRRNSGKALTPLHFHDAPRGDGIGLYLRDEWYRSRRRASLESREGAGASFVSLQYG